MRFIQYTPPLLARVLDTVYRYAKRYDADMFAKPPLETAAVYLEAAPYTYVIGDPPGAMIVGAPFVGTGGVAQIFAWDPVCFRRPAVYRAIARDAFARRNWTRLTAFVPDRNTLSRRSIEDVGFHLEGTLERSVRYNDGVGSFLVYGLLAEEV